MTCVPNELPASERLQRPSATRKRACWRDTLGTRMELVRVLLLHSQETAEVIRRRETLDDILATQAVPARLARIVDNPVMIDNP